MWICPSCAEKERSLKAAVETIQKGLEYLQTQVKQMSEKAHTQSHRRNTQEFDRFSRY
jgi:hypothetical protein